MNSSGPDVDIFYWRERNLEVDFLVRKGARVAAIELTTGRRKTSVSGLTAFERSFDTRRKLLVGGHGMPIDDVLEQPAEHRVR